MDSLASAQRMAKAMKQAINSAAESPRRSDARQRYVVHLMFEQWNKAYSTHTSVRPPEALTPSCPASSYINTTAKRISATSLNSWPIPFAFQRPASSCDATAQSIG